MRQFLLVIIVFCGCNSNNGLKPARTETLPGQISVPADSTQQADGKDGEPYEEYFTAISKNDIKLENPLVREWRFSFNEDKQTFDDYKKLNRRKIQPGKRKIYLLPIGNFSNTQKKVLELTCEYLQVYFQLPTILLAPISDKLIPDSAKRLRPGNNLQLYTPYILNNMLKGKIPNDGCSLMAIIEKDLYPHPAWNYVFGIASYEDRVGVSSIFRLQNGNTDSSNYKLCLRRLLNTASHEIGHMFSIHHCTLSKCVMNGSNSLNESDLQPLRLCSECQKKLSLNINYNNKKRLTELVNYLKINDLKDDLPAAQNDYNRLN